jgi:biopolymer transport protein ExbD
MSRRRRRATATIVPVASMGDIAFLLIIFFVLATTFAKDKQKVVQATSTDVEKISQPKLSVVLDTEGQLWLQGLKVDSAKTLERALSEMIEQRKKNSAAAEVDTEETSDLQLQGNEPNVVHFRCDREMPKSEFAPILEAIAQAGGVPALVGEKEAEKADKDKR